MTHTIQQRQNTLLMIMNKQLQVPDIKGWEHFFKNEEKQAYFSKLLVDVEYAYEHTTVFPPKPSVFRAFQMTPPQQIKVVLIGQDPYHGEGQADGLSFSMANKQAKIPPSIRNMFKELYDDLGIKRENYDLSDWATQGVLMLNRVLTVEKGHARSHTDIGWETFTLHVVEYIETLEQPIIYILWGNDAKKLIKEIKHPLHAYVTSAHPSPLSSYRGFFGSKPYSQVNAFLSEHGKSPINW